jgi:large subunit ribosomal protein L3
MSELLARKIGMTQVISEEGKAVPTTVLKAEPGVVIRVKTKSSDGYNALVIGYQPIAEKKVNKPEKGQFKNIDKMFKILKEMRLSELPDVKPGDLVLLSSFDKGDKVAVTGVSIGKGYQGTVKRWNFGRGPMSHGSKSHRIPGSIGGHTDPGRVFKGKKMAGHLGNVKVTQKNIEIVDIDEEANVILLRGGVPGAKNSWVTLVSTGEAKIMSPEELNNTLKEEADKNASQEEEQATDSSEEKKEDSSEEQEADEK